MSVMHACFHVEKKWVCVSESKLRGPQIRCLGERVSSLKMDQREYEILLVPKSLRMWGAEMDGNRLVHLITYFCHCPTKENASG